MCGKWANFWGRRGVFTLVPFFSPLTHIYYIITFAPNLFSLQVQFLSPPHLFQISFHRGKLSLSLG